jgi:hypothetical protein
MTFSIGNSKTRYKGVFVTKAKVRSIQDISHQPIEFMAKAFDLAIKVTFDIGRSFDKSVTIFGNFKRDSQGKIEDLGGAFKVMRFFEELGIKGTLTPSQDIPIAWLTAVEAKECCILDYLVGTKETDPTKGKYFTWDMVSKDEETLVMEFFRNVQKGFPKKFNPNALDAVVTDDQTSRGDTYEGPTDATPVEEMAF